MTLPPRFGPNHAAVEAFVASLDSIPWFSRVGEPTEHDAQLVRVGFEFLARHHADHYAPWGESLVNAETKIERLVFDHRRLSGHMEIQQVIRRRGPNPYVDDFFCGLEEKYPGYYGDTCSYAHELVEEPDRLIWGAAREIMLADIDPHLNFFQSMMPWLRAGHWPCGWEGHWPEGRLVLW
jgi:hypothetical protein